MKLILSRIEFGESTVGRLYIDGAFQCFTLEDKVRELPGKAVSEWKVKSQTAIPCGTYQVRITHSGRFNKMLPQILDVPGFAGIRIHAGNTKEDTEGCILLGTATDGTTVSGSRMAVDAFISKLSAALTAGDTVTIEVKGLPS